jgi:hypothetical protein
MRYAVVVGRGRRTARVAFAALAAVAACSPFSGVTTDTSSGASDAGGDGAADSASALADGGARPAADSAAGGGDAGASAEAGAGVDAGPLCDPTTAFGTPTPITSLNTQFSNNETALRLSNDLLTGYFGLYNGANAVDLYVATRTAPTGAFGAATQLMELNGAGNESHPSVTGDGLMIVFDAFGDTPTSNNWDLLYSTRASVGQPFGPPQPIAALNSTSNERIPFIMRDGKKMYFASERSGQSDLYESTIDQFGFGAPKKLTELSTSGDGHSPTVTPDGLVMYFGRLKPMAADEDAVEIMVTTRASASATWGNPVPAVGVNPDYGDWPDFITADRCTLYFHSTPSGGTSHTLYVANKQP